MEGSVASKLEGQTKAPDDTSGLVAENLQKAYRRRRVVEHVDFRVCRGEVVGLLGPNGAGKTTCFYMVMGLVKADGGQVLIDGYDVTTLPMYQRARLGLGYLPQEASIFRGLTVEQNIEAVAELAWPNRDKRKEVIENLLEEFSITHVRDSMATALSGGERRRLEIARALATSPDYMLLDEPFAGIDPLAIADIKALIMQLKERGLGVLITDHNVRDTLDIIDRASVIHGGRVLFEGPPEDVVTNEDVRRVYLGETYSA
ncbi:LPS export ABC transporter ATP-binding protein [Parvularcula sp. ZS-1/3]|uniref:Lipopolysaccharide export system ATP-binding protein LptB n=1 Tax=Parvularcula mediterranea TaxID=2732508 RepID=A0A7Y3RKY1_9PROT|nr:LPS export ABC transporter ATP-binding protein [Parvularcula mediterranea]NNU15989.1 LPS export ABC transporter ATP-binding protein [Parvularcula mediterranea]